MLSRLLSRLGLLRRDRLTFVSGPTAVSVVARVASPSTAESPMTGMRAALIEIAAGERVIIHDRSDDSQPREVFRELGSTILAGRVLLETPDGLIEVPVAGLKLRFPGTQNLAVMNIDRPLPPSIAHVVERLRDGAGCYRELSLSQGDLVELRAVVAPRPSEPGDPPGEAVPWIARPDLGPVVLVDRSIAGEPARFSRNGSWAVVAFFAILVAAFMIWSEYSNNERERRHPPPTSHNLRDTEGRTFDAACDGFSCKLEQTGGARTADREPRLSAISLFYPGRIVGVCARDPDVVAPDWAYCRALECSADADCPRLPDEERSTCVNGLCQKPSQSISVFDVMLLCNAGAGVGRAPSRDSDAPLAEGAVPPSCRQP